ncbi:MAG: histidinol dehydrogenase [Polyangiaceae bacterium UTPRO1]|jgi:histidinol dehydrogenase|nr:histidinol dehydrogenase [Myxococcales bacterium]OQY67898.1 MAG: histidinol dehydrogenase [Polyangiaceae bacterium UTPRO1]
MSPERNLLVVVPARGRAFTRRLALLEGRGEEAMGGVERTVRAIIAAVRRRGDAALFAYTERFDGVALTARNVEVPRAELAAAAAALPPPVRRALALAVRRVAAFHRRQRQGSWSFRDAAGARLGQQVRPLDRVGVYVPGGTAAYPSSVIMNVVPAKVAGVGEVIGVTPPGRADTAVLAAAHLAGIDRLFRVGGAQAVAALAYGTRSIPRVDKVCGPGNVFVATAKRLVFGAVDIDMIAGPSEVLIVADGRARPDFVAADLLSQAEHDPLAAAILVTPSAALAARVARALARQLAELPRQAIARRALGRYGTAFITATLAEAVELANRIAPEHLELMVQRPERWLGQIRHAGAIFLGAYAPEPLGDYLAGPNHVLPTGGSARFASPLGVYDFVKRSSVIAAGPRTLAKLGPVAARLARLEGLDAHARAVEMRLQPRR